MKALKTVLRREPSLRKEEIEEIKDLYEFPLKVFNETFPEYKNCLGIFSSIFSTFDINKEEALDFVKTANDNIKDYLYVKGVLFNLKDFKELMDGREKYSLIKLK